VYSIAEIVDDTEADQPYTLNNKIANSNLILKMGNGKTGSYSMKYISNSAVQPQEFLNWIDDLSKFKKSPPSLQIIKNLEKKNSRHR